MASIDVLGPRLKVTRAKAHIRNLESVLEAFIADNPHRVEFYEDTQQPGIAVRGAFDRPLPNDTPTIIGDAIHNLRASLDHLAANAVRAAGGTPDRNTGFPIYKCEADFKGGAKSKLAGAPDAFVAFVEGLKPYKDCADGSGGNMRLWVLGQLDNLDKHMVLLPSVGVLTVSFEVTDPSGAVVADVRDMSVSGDGHVNAVSIGGKGLQYEIKGEPSYRIQFSDTGLVDDASVGGVLLSLEEACSDIIREAAKLNV